MHDFLYYDINDFSTSSDINLYNCGTEQCARSYGFGPAVRDHYLLHFVLEGEGKFEVDGREYRLRKGQAFLIVPDVVTYYEADRDNPWQYSWVGFNGIKTQKFMRDSGLSRGNPIFPAEDMRVSEEALNLLKQCLNSMIRLSSSPSRSRDIKLQAVLYELIGTMVDAGNNGVSDENCEKVQDLYVDTAVRFIAANYSRKVSIGELARYVGIDRSYLYELFIERFFVSPQEFLIRYRMVKACELLLQGGLTVGAVSWSVGYEDQLTFSRMFKKVIGKSPMAYRTTAPLKD